MQATTPFPPAPGPSRPSPARPAGRPPLTQLARLQPGRGGDHKQEGQEAAGAGHHGPSGRQLDTLGLPSASAAPPLPRPGRLLRGRARRRDWAQPRPRTESHWGGREPSPAGASPAPPSPARRPPKEEVEVPGGG